MAFPVQIKAVFLDRDGVVNEICKHPELKDKNGKICEDPLSLKEFKIKKGVIESVNELKKSGYEVIIASNQPGLVKGFYKKELLDEINRYIMEKIGIKHIHYCLHYPDYYGECECRKPKPGLIVKASREWFIDLNKSFVVGYREEDMIAGRKAGCRTVLLDENDEKRDIKADFRIKDLKGLIGIIKS